MRQFDRNFSIVGSLLAVVALIAAIGLDSFLRGLGAIIVALALLGAAVFWLSRSRM